MSFVQNDVWSENLHDHFQELIEEWAKSKQLTNAYYSLYKSERNREDALESQIRSLIEVHPLSKKEWSEIQAKVEKNEG